jgi:transcriptional regulator with XRE-family HTH domain
MHRTIVLRCGALASMAIPNRSDRHNAALKRLARALNVPAETFLGEPPEGVAGELFVLVRHWLAIEDSQGRRRVLSAARQEAERSGYKECA